MDETPLKEEQPTTEEAASQVLRAMAQAGLAAAAVLLFLIVIEWLPTRPGDEATFPAGYMPVLLPLLTATLVLWAKSRPPTS